MPSPDPRGWMQRDLAAELARLEVIIYDLGNLSDTLGGAVDELARHGLDAERIAHANLRAARADTSIATNRLSAAALAIAVALGEPRRPLP